MDNSTYLVQSEATEAKFPEGKELLACDLVRLDNCVRRVKHEASCLDEFKRHAFYGENPTELVKWPAFLSQERIEALHAAVGVVTEASELMTTLLGTIQNPSADFDKVNIREEIGDLFWYVAILQRQFNLSAEEIYDTNIAKLKARYPDKFDTHRALNRDLDAERQAMETA